MMKRMSTTDEKNRPLFEHDCEVSLVPCVGKCHYLGTDKNSEGEEMDLYIHVREEKGRTELLARFGNEGAEYLSASLGGIFYGSQRAQGEAAGAEGYGIRLAYDAAMSAGYNLRALNGFGDFYEDPDQAYLDAMSDGGNPYTDAAGMVDEGADTFQY
jgi:hypothetical protein